MLPCVNKTLFGIDCTGCGTQRAALLLFRGQFTEAFYMYPAIYLMLFLVVFLLINLFVKFKHDHKIKIGLIILTASVMAGSYIIKMYHLFHLTN
ncbi:hypothetical protein LPB144_02630 [Christiangramia salexigens]|uniref:DUF2752 domain-containing protein n=2 Tax=Christiangramia salexigens TaxID=1913577 RepID=A0A1L3J2M3_9FLAO|nr:hypothetical protein LPB144_02630 [Christiangramia salexigens]